MARRKEPTEANYFRLDAARGRLQSLIREWESLQQQGAPEGKIAAAWAKVEVQRVVVEVAFANFNERFPHVPQRVRDHLSRSRVA